MEEFPITKKLKVDNGNGLNSARDCLLASTT